MRKPSPVWFTITVGNVHRVDGVAVVDEGKEMQCILAGVPRVGREPTALGESIGRGKLGSLNLKCREGVAVLAH